MDADKVDPRLQPQFVCESFDKSKCQPDMKIYEIILGQFDIPGNEPRPIDAQRLYMPEEEQEKMARWMLARWIPLKKIRPKSRQRQELGMINLNYFPTSIRRSENDA